MRTIRKIDRLLVERKHLICKRLASWLPRNVVHACNLAAGIKYLKIHVMFKTLAAVFYRDLKPRGAAEWF